MFRTTQDDKVLTEKLENNNRKQLSTNWNIYTGSIVIGKPSPFVIDDSKRQQLIATNSSCREVIGRVLLRSQQKWETEPAHLIKILSSSKKEWPWSGANDEAEAERFFKETYPAIRKHLISYGDKLKKKVDRGKYWWELKSTNFYPMLHQPKIVYSSVPGVNRFMRAGYDKEGIPTEEYLHSILPADLHLLAILNSSLFNWYAQAKFNKSEKKLDLNLCKKNMEQVPIASMTIEQKVNLSLLVHRILNNPNSPEVADIERKIDQLVYKLYQLTDTEIASIKKGTNQ